MALLDQIRRPDDLRRLSRDELEVVAAEIRSFLVSHVSRTGGHLGPNLGVVELTMAIHRVFDSPRDPVIFDTGHQSYVHKILTGRQAGFESLRQEGGLSGYPSRRESEHDWVESSHASASLSWAEGMAQAFRLRGEDRTVVAVIGDGALTGGMSWEALNNIAEQDDLRVVIVVNDNGRSYTPTVGGLSRHLGGLRTDPRYEQALDAIKRKVTATPVVGRPAYNLMHGLKVGAADVLVRQTLFSDLGMKYVGPINGHDLGAVETALRRARKFGGPVLVHCITEKGKGFAAAEAHEEDRFHAVGKIDAETGQRVAAPHETTGTDVFADEIARIADERADVVGITAAMLHPVGLARMAQEHPERVFDAGIAEQHAVASSAGLAAAGLHPVVAVYSTFLNRAFDQLVMDVGLHHAGVTFVLDRAGITGPDGASHHGIWDCSIAGIVPGLQLAAPRDEIRLREALRRAVDVDDAPTVIRYGKGAIAEDMAAVRTVDGVDVMSEDEFSRVLLVGVGPMVLVAQEAAELLRQRGIGVRVVDPVWALPVPSAIIDMARESDLVVTVEDSLEVSGVGSRVSQAIRKAGITTPTRELGVPQDYIDHASRESILASIGLTPEGVADAVEQMVR